MGNIYIKVNCIHCDNMNFQRCNHPDIPKSFWDWFFGKTCVCYLERLDTDYCKFGEKHKRPNPPPCPPKKKD